MRPLCRPFHSWSFRLFGCSLGFVGFIVVPIRVRSGGHRVHSGSLGIVVCTLGVIVCIPGHYGPSRWSSRWLSSSFEVVGFILCRWVHSGVPWVRRVHSGSLGSFVSALRGIG